MLRYRDGMMQCSSEAMNDKRNELLIDSFCSF